MLKQLKEKEKEKEAPEIYLRKMLDTYGICRLAIKFVKESIIKINRI